MFRYFDFAKHSDHLLYCVPKVVLMKILHKKNINSEDSLSTSTKKRTHGSPLRDMYRPDQVSSDGGRRRGREELSN